MALAMLDSGESGFSSPSGGYEDQIVMRFPLTLCLLAFLGACSQGSRQGDIAVIGDSVMAWNRENDRDVARVMSEETALEPGRGPA